MRTTWIQSQNWSSLLKLPPQKTVNNLTLCLNEAVNPLRAPLSGAPASLSARLWVAWCLGSAGRLAGGVSTQRRPGGAVPSGPRLAAQLTGQSRFHRTPPARLQIPHWSTFAPRRLHDRRTSALSCPAAFCPPFLSSPSCFLAACPPPSASPLLYSTHRSLHNRDATKKPKQGEHGAKRTCSEDNLSYSSVL